MPGEPRLDGINISLGIGYSLSVLVAGYFKLPLFPAGLLQALCRLSLQPCRSRLTSQHIAGIGKLTFQLHHRLDLFGHRLLQEPAIDKAATKYRHSQCEPQKQGKNKGAHVITVKRQFPDKTGIQHHQGQGAHRQVKHIVRYNSQHDFL